jgi:hypothetical protein
MIELLAKMGVPKQYAGDVWLLLLFIAASIVLILIVKKRNLGATLVAVYVAYAIVTKSFFSFLAEPGIKLLYFIGVLFAVFQLVKRFFKMGIGGKKAVMWSKILLVAFSIVGLLGSVVMGWFSKEAVSEFFSPLSLQLFRTDQAQLVWMVVPLVLIFVLVYRKM